MSKKVLITGGSGLIGTHLTPMLMAAGYQVAWLSRSQNGPEGVTVYHWDPSEGVIDPSALANTHAIIHLAGAGVAEKRWTAQRKKLLWDSRTETANLLLDAIQKSDHKPQAFISASAVGYYGLDTGDRWMEETNDQGADFLAKLTGAWEEEVEKFGALGMRVAKLRIGIVLAAEGGALARLSPTVRWGLGAVLGTGKQYMSWIHIQDVCGMFLYALENEGFHGPYNAVGPNPATNRELTRALARILQRPLWLPPVPGFALRLAFGEMAGILLGGNRVSSRKWEPTDYTFQYPILEHALRHLLQSPTNK